MLKNKHTNAGLYNIDYNIYSYFIYKLFNATPLQISHCLGRRQEYLIRSLIFCILLAIYTYNNSQNTLRNRKILQILPINSCAFINTIIHIFTILKYLLNILLQVLIHRWSSHFNKRLNYNSFETKNISFLLNLVIFCFDRLV